MKNNIKSDVTDFRKRTNKNIFPRIYQKDKIVENKSLQRIKLQPHKKGTKNKIKILYIPFTLQIGNLAADVYLYVNGVKKDVFYSVTSGRYQFYLYGKYQLIKIELFYLLNGWKSPSIFKTLEKK